MNFREAIAALFNGEKVKPKSCRNWYFLHNGKILEEYNITFCSSYSEISSSSPFFNSDHDEWEVYKEPKIEDLGLTRGKKRILFSDCNLRSVGKVVRLKNGTITMVANYYADRERYLWEDSDGNAWNCFGESRYLDCNYNISEVLN